MRYLWVEKLTSQLRALPIAGRFFEGALWSLLASVLSQGLMFVASLIIARILGREAYGHFVIIQSTLTMLGVLAGFGVGSSASRYIAELKDRDPARLGRILTLTESTVIILGMTISVGLASTASFISTNILSSPFLTMDLAVASIAVFFSTLDGFYKSSLIGFGAMRSFATAAILGAVATLPILIWLAHSHSVFGLAIGLSISACLQSIPSFILVRAQYRQYHIKYDLRKCLEQWTILRDFAFPLLLAGILVTAAQWSVQAMLARSPNGYNQVAILGIAMQWYNMILFLPAVAGRIVTPMLTEYITSGRNRDSQQLLKVAMSTNALISLPVAVIVAILSSSILVNYGHSFAGESSTLIIAVFTASLLATMSPVAATLAATSRMWLGLAMNLGWATIYISLFYLLRQHGAFGAISALAIAYTVHSIWTFWFAYSHIRR